MRKWIALAVLPALVALGACTIERIEGSGNIVTEERDVRGFNSVSLSTMGDVTIVQGDVESLTVRADDNFMQYIVSEVKNGDLHLGISKLARQARLRPTRQIEFRLTVDDLDGIAVAGSGSVRSPELATDRLDIAVSGSGDVEIVSLSADAVDIAISGSGNVELRGETDRQSVAISGSGRYEAPGLQSRRAEVAISGSGNATVDVTDSLDAHVSGSGSLAYYGDPKVARSVTGSGTVRSIGSRKTVL
jgi:hypothetical protein